MIFQLAWKNIWRNPKRSLTVILAIAFGLWGALFSGAVMTGMAESMVESAINRDLGHLQIHHPKFTKEKKIQQFIIPYTRIETFLKENFSQVLLVKRSVIFAMASSPTASAGVKVCAIEADHEIRVTSIEGSIVQGSFLKSALRNEIAVGEKLARRLKLKIKSRLVLSFQNRTGEIIYIACRIGGIYKTGSARFDEMQVYIREQDLFAATGSAPFYHELAMRCTESTQISAVRDALRTEFPDQDIRDWQELAPELALISLMMQNFTYLFVLIILLALLFGITNTMLMSIIDRIRELGILLAVGMKRGRIITLILLEALFLSLSGGLTGIGLAAIAVNIFSRHGIDLTVVASSLESFGAGTTLYPKLPAEMYLIITLMIIFTANLAAFLPALKILRLRPAEAVRIYT